MKQTIYRKEALARLASPEQLDQLMPLTSPRAWIALGTAVMVLLAGLAWAVVGSLAIEVEGQGVLLRPDGIRHVLAPESGSVARLAVSPGDEVQPRQELLRLTPSIDEHEPLIVTSPLAARVLEIAVGPHEAVEQGAALVSLEATDRPLQAVLYVPAADAYQVEREMSVAITPAIARGSRTTAVLGRVRSAGRFPATRSSMLRTLLSEDLVTALSASGPCLEVVVELLPGSEAVLREFYSGMPCRARITIRKYRPVNLVFPAFGDAEGS